MLCYKFEFAGERILKVGECLAKLWTTAIRYLRPPGFVRTVLVLTILLSIFV